MAIVTECCDDRCLQSAVMAIVSAVSAVGIKGRGVEKTLCVEASQLCDIPRVSEDTSGLHAC